MKVRLMALVFLGVFTLGILPAHSELVEYLTTYKMHIGEKTKKIRLICLIPQTIDNVQIVHGIKYSRPTTSAYESEGNNYAEFVVDSEKGDITIGISVVLEIFNHDLNTVKKGITASFGPPENYLSAEKYLEKDDKQIASLSPTLKSKNTLRTIKNIYNYVNHTLKYKTYNGQKGAVKALQDLTGDCTEFTDLFVTLCRSCNIPCIAAYGYVTQYTNTPRHSWAEVYCPPYGWFRVDPTNTKAFNRLENRYIHFSSLRNNRTLGGFFYKYTYWGDPVEIKQDILIRNFK